jgi:hypothetical protein
MHYRSFARGLAVAGLVMGFALGMTVGMTRDAAAASILIDNGATTYDPATGLAWLDLTATVGQSYDAVIGGFGGYLADGWRYATPTELGQLFTDAGGIGPFDFTATLQNHPAASELLGLLGILYSSFPYASSMGLLSVESFPGGHQQGQIALSVFTAGSLNLNAGGLGDAFGDAFTGSFLVKQVATTPIPAALPLFAAALGGLGFIGWRRKRSSAA